MSIESFFEEDLFESEFRFTPEAYFTGFLTRENLMWGRATDWRPELASLNTHDLPFSFDEAGTMWIETAMIRIWIEKRRSDCNRGRYGMVVWSKQPTRITIDEHDMFPRYFFSLQRLFDELNDYMTFNKFSKEPLVHKPKP
jgi:hypothetical protein